MYLLKFGNVRVGGFFNQLLKLSRPWPVFSSHHGPEIVYVSVTITKTITNLLSRQAKRRDTGASPGSSRAHGRPQSMFLITLKVVPRKSDHGLMAKTDAT